MQNPKMLIALRYYLLGAKMHLGLQALEFAFGYHKGLRKDGKTHEFEHQIGIANYLRTLTLMHPEETLAAAFLHDTYEDYSVPLETIEKKFGTQVMKSVDLLSKVKQTSAGSIKLDNKAYFSQMQGDPIATLVKGADRINNQGSMVGTFTKDKQKSYMEETETFILPMLKRARRLFPQQEAAYQNIKFALDSQIELIKAIHQAGEQNASMPVLQG